MRFLITSLLFLFSLNLVAQEIKTPPRQIKEGTPGDVMTTNQAGVVHRRAAILVDTQFVASYVAGDIVKVSTTGTMYRAVIPATYPFNVNDAAWFPVDTRLLAGEVQAFEADATALNAVVDSSAALRGDICETIYPLVTGETGVLSTCFKVGDSRRYGVVPDGVTNWEGTTSFVDNWLTSSLATGAEAYLSPGFYNTGINVLKDKSGLVMRFGEGAELANIFHLISGDVTVDPTGADGFLSDVTIHGTVTTYDRVGIQDARNLYIESIHCKSDVSKHPEGSKGRGVHIHWLVEDLTVDRMTIEDIDTSTNNNHAALAIDGFPNNPKRIKIGSVHIKKSDVNGAYILGNDVNIGTLRIDEWGRTGLRSTSAGLEGAGADQNATTKALWVNLSLNLNIGNVVIDQNTTDSRPTAKIAVLFDETGVNGGGSPATINSLDVSNVSGQGVHFGEPSEVSSSRWNYINIGDISVSVPGSIDAGFSSININKTRSGSAAVVANVLTAKNIRVAGNNNIDYLRQHNYTQLFTTNFFADDAKQRVIYADTCDLSIANLSVDRTGGSYLTAPTIEVDGVTGNIGNTVLNSTLFIGQTGIKVRNTNGFTLGAFEAKNYRDAAVVDIENVSGFSAAKLSGNGSGNRGNFININNVEGQIASIRGNNYLNGVSATGTNDLCISYAKFLTVTSNTDISAFDCNGAASTPSPWFTSGGGIRYNGLVGIGANPGFPLHVNGTAYATNFRSASVSNSYMFQGVASGQSTGFYVNGTGNVRMFVTNANATRSMDINPDGNSFINAGLFAIGHTAPSAQLDVIGGFELSDRSSGVATSLAGWASNNRSRDVTLGSGLELINGALASTTLTSTQDVNFSGFRGTNLASPTAGTDAANKDYVDAAPGIDPSWSITAVAAVDTKITLYGVAAVYTSANAPVTASTTSATTLHQYYLTKTGANYRVRTSGAIQVTSTFAYTAGQTYYLNDAGDLSTTSDADFDSAVLYVVASLGSNQYILNLSDPRHFAN